MLGSGALFDFRLQSFLRPIAGRPQRVTKGSVLSTELNNNMGVPQGSALSCILIVLFLADIAADVQGAKADSAARLVRVPCPCDLWHATHWWMPITG